MIGVSGHLPVPVVPLVRTLLGLLAYVAASVLFAPSKRYPCLADNAEGLAAPRTRGDAVSFWDTIAVWQPHLRDYLDGSAVAPTAPAGHHHAKLHLPRPLQDGELAKAATRKVQCPRHITTPGFR